MEPEATTPTRPQRAASLDDDDDDDGFATPAMPSTQHGSLAGDSAGKTAAAGGSGRKLQFADMTEDFPCSSAACSDGPASIATADTGAVAVAVAAPEIRARVGLKFHGQHFLATISSASCASVLTTRSGVQISGLRVTDTEMNDRDAVADAMASFSGIPALPVSLAADESALVEDAELTADVHVLVCEENEDDGEEETKEAGQTPVVDLVVQTESVSFAADPLPEPVAVEEAGCQCDPQVDPRTFASTESQCDPIVDPRTYATVETQCDPVEPTEFDPKYSEAEFLELRVKLEADIRARVEQELKAASEAAVEEEKSRLAAIWRTDLEVCVCGRVARNLGGANDLHRWNGGCR